MGFFSNLFKKKSLQGVHSSRGWSSLLLHESYSGAWQKNDELKREEVTAFYAVFACVSMISKDMGKLGIQLKRKQDGVLVGVDIPSRFRVLIKPNNFQTWQQFQEFWTSSLLLRGNTYVLKVRDVFGEVCRMVVLNPDLVQPLVDEHGNVFYQLSNDELAQTEFEIVPASEIIHDRINAFYHPLVGLTPIMACGIAAGMGQEIQKGSRTFFGNGSRPGGVLVAPGPISVEKAQAVSAQWNSGYSGENIGKTAILGDGMKYTPLSITATDAQMIQHLDMSARIVCSAFNVPPFKIHIVDAGKNPSESNEIYYSDCLQSHIEARENLLDDGLELKSFGLEAFFDLDALIRMDSSSKIAFLKEAVGSGLLSPNEARQKLGYLPVVGGESPVMQQQNYSLSALAKRDARDDPFATGAPPPLPTEEAEKSQYQGVFKSENQYKKGQFVTKSGSLWHCEADHVGEFDHKNFKLAQKKWGDE